MSKRLNDPVWAIKYIEAIMRKDVKEYYEVANCINEGPDCEIVHIEDISKRPDILGTLFNVGKSDKKANDLADRIDKWVGNRIEPYPVPQNNEMGYWISTRAQYIRQMLSQK